MKDKEKIYPSKKKILLYYLILAACILVAAAITVGVVFAVRGNKNITIEKPDDPVDTSSKYEFITPVKDVELLKAHVFAYDKTMDWYCLHEGMDFIAKAGTEVFAAVDGEIANIETNDELYGSVITIKHENGVTTVYKFVTPVEGLKKGDTVNRGDVIAKVASFKGVEHEDGDHLHFEVYKNDEVVDPDEYLFIVSK